MSVWKRYMVSEVGFELYYDQVKPAKRIKLQSHEFVRGMAPLGEII